MTVYYSGQSFPSGSAPPDPGDDLTLADRYIVFYVLASHTRNDFCTLHYILIIHIGRFSVLSLLTLFSVTKRDSTSGQSTQKVSWYIDSVLPRIPCTDEHKEVRIHFSF
jgi:hypothetical protein